VIKVNGGGDIDSSLSHVTHKVLSLLLEAHHRRGRYGDRERLVRRVKRGKKREEQTISEEVDHGWRLSGFTEPLDNVSHGEVDAMRQSLATDHKLEGK
jgi:hypothetical protein